jgi:hypothetical protein
MSEQLVLVDKSDRELGTAGVFESHTGDGVLHRAFTILVSNARGEVLVQKRSSGNLEPAKTSPPPPGSACGRSWASTPLSRPSASSATRRATGTSAPRTSCATCLSESTGALCDPTRRRSRSSAGCRSKSSTGRSRMATMTSRPGWQAPSKSRRHRCDNETHRALKGAFALRLPA